MTSGQDMGRFSNVTVSLQNWKFILQNSSELHKYVEGCIKMWLARERHRIFSVAEGTSWTLPERSSDQGRTTDVR